MREILFKAKRVDNGKWVEWLLWKKKYNDGNRIFISCFPDKDDNEKVYVVCPETLCQFTGLRDKHGKRIFEGDIVKNEYQKGHYQYFKIFYCDRSYMWQGENKYGMLSKVYQMLGTLEVIGNRFDNPELLTAER